MFIVLDSTKFPQSQSALSRKRRANDAETSTVFSDKLTWDNELKFIGYGENKAEVLEDDQEGFSKKIKQYLQNSIMNLPGESKDWLTEKAYPSDYELGYLSGLAYEDAPHDILKLLEDNLKIKSKQIADELNQLGSSSSSVEQRHYEARRRKLLNKQSELEKEKRLVSWKVLGKASHYSMTNGYVGIVCWDSSRRYLVIAHRGTKPNSLGALWTDFKGIMMNRKVAQMDSATTFCHLVLKSLPIEIKSISFTGHSLGGWLASVTTFSSKYLERIDNYFKKREKFIYHPHTVIFDSPGCQPMLLKLQRSFDLRYRISSSALSIHTLDIRVYLSAPNLVNTNSLHVGTIYRLFPKLESYLGNEGAGRSYSMSSIRDFLQKHLTYTVKMHSINNLLTVFPKDEDRPTEQEVQLVRDWPIVSSLMNKEEYKQFFLKADKLNDYHLTDESLMSNKLGFRIRYLAQIIDLKSSNIHIFDFEERQFLNSMAMLQDWFEMQKGHTVSDLQELNELYHFFKSENIDKPTMEYITQLFSAYRLTDHGETLRVRNLEASIVPVINGLKCLLRRYPTLISVIQLEIKQRPTLIQSIYSSESDRWINTLQDQINLRWKITPERLNLIDFLTDEKARVLHITVDSEEIKLILNQLGYDMLVAIEKRDNILFSQLSGEKKNALGRYINSDSSTFLNTDQIRLQHARGFSITDFYQSEKSSPVLWLDGELAAKDVWHTILFGGNLIKKVIIVTRRDGEFDYFLNHQRWEEGAYHQYTSEIFTYSDLTLESQQHVLEKVTVQGGKNLAKLVGLDDLKEISSNVLYEKIKILDRILTEEILIQLGNKGINIGSYPERLAYMEEAYMYSEDRFIKDKLKTALLTDFLQKEATRYLIISGMYDVSLDVVKTKLFSYLELTADTYELEALKSKMGFYDISEDENKRIFIASNSFDERNFREFCHDYNSLELKVDWIHWDNGQFFLKYLYDPQFYIDRKFYYKDKIIILSKIKDVEVSLQVGEDLFVFNDINFNKRPKFLIWLRSALDPFTPTISEHGFNQFQKDENIKNIRVTLISEDREALFKSINQINPTHWLKQDSQGQLVWHRSEMSLETLYPYVDESRTNNAQELLTEADFIQKINKRTALIIDDPGMGKTTVLTKLSESVLESNWIIRINFLNQNGAIRCLPTGKKINLNEVIEFIVSTDRLGLNSDIARKLLKFKLENPNEGLPLLLLFDGFDEIQDSKSESKEKVSLLLNFLRNRATVWVTSRKNEVKLLKNSLFVFGTQLEELGRDVQERFFKKHWHTQLFQIVTQDEGIFERKCEIYIKALLDKVNDLFKQDNPRFVGIPLQLQLLSEGFLDGFKEFLNNEISNIPQLDNISILNLFRKFIDARYHIFFKKLGISDYESILRKATVEYFIKIHRRLAIKQLLGDEEASEIVGIKPPFSVDGKEGSAKIDARLLEQLFLVGFIQPVGQHDYEFIHKSFAEYFLTEFLINQIAKKVPEHHNHGVTQKLLLTNILIKPEHQLIRIFLNEQLAGQLALSFDSFNEYAEAIEVFWTDNPGDFFYKHEQTALHVAIEEQHHNIFNYLVELFKARPEGLISIFSARDGNGDTALYLATKQDKMIYVSQFLETIKKCSADIQEKLLLSTLFRTDEDEKDPVIKKLIEYIRNHTDGYPKIFGIVDEIIQLRSLIGYFLEAAENGSLKPNSLDNSKLIDHNTGLEYHINSNIKTSLFLVTNQHRATALHLSIMNSHVQSALELIKQGAMVDVEAQYSLVSVDGSDGILRYDIIPTRDESVTPLQIAVSQKQYLIANSLLEAGARVNVGRDDNAPLYLAATLNRVDMMRSLLNKNADPDLRALTGETPNYWAAFYNNQEMMDILQDKKNYYVDINIKASDGYTPLCWAVSHNNEYMVEQLLKSDVKANTDYVDEKPLRIAIHNNNPSILNLLLKKGPISRGNIDNLLLLLAVRDNLQNKDKNDREATHNIVELLLTYGVEVNTEQNGETALYWAVKKNDEALVDILLKADADTNVQLPNGETALYWAVKNKNLKILDKLIKKWALVNIDVRENGIVCTPLSLAREIQDKEIETILLREGAQDNLKRGNDYQAYFSIRTNDKIELGKLLQEVDINTSYAGKTLLHWALIFKRYEIVNTLLQQGAKVDVKTINGDSTLYLAIKYALNSSVKEAYGIIKILLDRDVDVNVKLQNGDPLLCWIIRKSVLHKDTIVFVELLLQYHPDVNALSKYHETASYLAIRYSFHSIIERLFERDINVDIELVNGETLLYWAVRNNLDVVVDKLLERGASRSVNIGLTNGETPLYWAVINKSLRNLKKLLEHGARDSMDVKVMGKVPLEWARYYKYEDIVEELSINSISSNLKRTHEESEDDHEELKKRRGYYQNPAYCLPGPSGYLSSDRRRRNLIEGNCEISWGDVDEFNEESEDPREFNKIKINSDKFLSVLRSPSLSETKRAQLVQLAEQVFVTGKSKEQVTQLARHQSKLKYLNKISYISNMVTSGMMAKNILRDLLQGDYEDVAINIGFIAGGQGLARVAEAVSSKGAVFIRSEQYLLGQSLRLASPFLARGTSVFIVYDLINQIKAYKEGNPDALIGVVGDGIYLGVDGVVIGVELAEIAGLIEGVSAVTGPLGLAISTVVFVGTDVYLATKKVDQIDVLIHLTETEKFFVGLRAFIGMNPQEYIGKAIRKKQANNKIFKEGINFLKKNQNIQQYILPTAQEEATCIPERRAFASSFRQSRVIGIANSNLENCKIRLKIDLDSTVFLNQKKNGFKWSRTKPDVTEGGLFCSPKGEDIEIPKEGAFWCENAIGIEFLDSRTGNATFIDLGVGNDRVIGTRYGDHIIMLDNGRKNVLFGAGDDIFLVRGNLTKWSSSLDGGQGINTLELGPHTQALKDLNVTNIHNYILWENESDEVYEVSCDTHYIDGRGGKDDHRRDIIRIAESCAYSLKVAVKPHTFIANYAGNKENKFIYFIPTATTRGNATLSLGHSQGVHQVVFDYVLSDIFQLTKVNDPEYNLTRITVKKDVRNESIRKKSTFKIEFYHTDKTELSYVLRDNILIKVFGNNFYAFQRTNRSVSAIIRDYSLIAKQLPNLSIFLHTTLTNESIAIRYAQPQDIALSNADPQRQIHYAVLSNDPHYRTHLIGIGQDTIYAIHSGVKVLDESDLPIPEVVLYSQDNQNLTNTLDLREIRNQLKESYGVEIKSRVRKLLNSNDMVIEFFFSRDVAPELEKVVIMVRLKDASLRNWHEGRLHIILNHGLMELDGLNLKPLPLNFDSKKAIIVISPDDVEEYTKITIDRKLDNYHFYHFKNNLIISNIFNSNLTEIEYCTLFLKNFYQTPKLQTLSIKFIGEEAIVLESKMRDIRRARSFILGQDRYNQTFYNMLFSQEVTEESVLPVPYSHTFFYTPSGYQQKKPSEVVNEKRLISDKGGMLISYISYPLIGVGGAVIIGMGYRLYRRMHPGVLVLPGVVESAAVVLPLLAESIKAEPRKKVFDYLNGNQKYLNVDSHSIFFESSDCIKSKRLLGGDIGFCSLNKGERVLYWIKESENSLVHFKSYRRDIRIIDRYVFNYENKGEWVLPLAGMSSIPLEIFERGALPEFYKRQLAYERALVSVKEGVLFGMGHYIGSIISLHTPIGDVFKLCGLLPDWRTRDDVHVLSRMYITIPQLLSVRGLSDKFLSLSAGFLELGLLHPQVKSWYAYMTKGDDYLKLKFVLRLLGDVMQLGMYNASYVARILAHCFPTNEWVLKLSIGIQLASQFYMQIEDINYWYLGLVLFVLPYIPSALESIGIPVTRGMESLCNGLAQLLIGQSILSQIPKDKERIEQRESELMLADKRVNGSFIGNRFALFFNKSNDELYAYSTTQVSSMRQGEHCEKNMKSKNPR